MKKFITFLLLIFMVTPVFAHMNTDGTYSPNVSELPIARFRTILYNEYNKRTQRGEIDRTGSNFDQLVECPTIEFMQAYDEKFNGKNYRPDYTEEELDKFMRDYIKEKKVMERFDLEIFQKN